MGTLKLVQVCIASKKIGVESSLKNVQEKKDFKYLDGQTVHTQNSDSNNALDLLEIQRNR